MRKHLPLFLQLALLFGSAVVFMAQTEHIPVHRDLETESGLPPPFKSVVASSPPESPLSSYDNGGEFATDNTSLPSVFRVSRSSWACAA